MPEKYNPLRAVKRTARVVVISLLVYGIGLLIPNPAYCVRGKITVQVMGHYTDDVEWGNEEWTFEVNARAIRNGQAEPWGLKTISTWTGDSDPNNNDWHDLEDKTIFQQVLPLELPEQIEIKQWGWENDRGPRKIYNCCKWYLNDDDSYGTGTKTIDVGSLPNKTWKEFDWPDLKGSHGLKIRVKVERVGPPDIKAVIPNRGCRGRENQPVKLTGSNFADGMTVDIQGLGVDEFDITVSSPNEINFKINISQIAPLGARNVRLSTPGQPASADVLEDGFTVLRASNEECSKIP